MKNLPSPDSEARLTAALREWVVDAPLPPRFEEQVWRRISRLETREEEALGVVRWLWRVFRRPQVAYAYVAVLAALGIAAGTWTAQLRSSQTDAALGSRYMQSLDPYYTAANAR